MDEVFIRIRNRQPLAAAFGLWGGLVRVTVLTNARGAGCRFGGSGVSNAVEDIGQIARISHTDE